MARDLIREQQRDNGHSGAEDLATDLLGDLPDAGPSPGPEQIPRALREARQDRGLAAIAGLLVRAAQALDPITRIIVSKALAISALAAGVGLTAYTLSLPTSWERVATCGLFLALSAWTIRRGQA